MGIHDKKHPLDDDDDLVDLTGYKKSKFTKSKESKIKPSKKKEKSNATAIPKDHREKDFKEKENSGDSIKSAKASKKGDRDHKEHKEDKDKDKLKRAQIKAEEREREREREKEREKEKERERRAELRSAKQPQNRPPKQPAKRPAQSKQNQLNSALLAIQTAKPFVDATPEQERKMTQLVRMQEQSGFFKLTESFCKVIGQNFNALKMEAISKSFNQNAWATSLFMVYVDYKLAPLKSTYIKEYDRAKLWVYKNFAVSQKKLENAAVLRLGPQKATTDINLSKK